MTRTPGYFNARCRMWTDVPLSEVLADSALMDRAALQTYGPNKGDLLSRWDKKRATEVVAVQCDLDTTDRAEFEAHMHRLHDGGLYRWTSPSLDPGVEREGRAYRPRTLAAKPERHRPGPVQGRAFKPSRKSIAEELWTCPTCGLVGQVVGEAGRLWRDEHRRGCALAASA